MMRRTFLQSLSAVAAAFALPWKGEDKLSQRFESSHNPYQFSKVFERIEN